MNSSLKSAIMLTLATLLLGVIGAWWVYMLFITK